MNKTTKSSRLQGKDLMNIGIYSAIYCVIVTGVAMLGYIPIMMPMLCVLVPLIAGVLMVATFVLGGAGGNELISGICLDSSSCLFVEE